MKILIIFVVFLGVTIVAFSNNAKGSKLKLEKTTSKEHEHEENVHTKDNDHDHEDDKHGHEEDEHGHGGGKAVGPGKAILEVSEQNGFKLSREAFQALEVKFLNYDPENFLVTKNELVSFQNLTGIYRYRDGFFKFVHVSIKGQKNGKYQVLASSLKPGDKIVTSPIGLIRITDVYSTDTSEYGHGH